MLQRTTSSSILFKTTLNQPSRRAVSQSSLIYPLVVYTALYCVCLVGYGTTTFRSHHLLKWISVVFITPGRGINEREKNNLRCLRRRGKSSLKSLYLKLLIVIFNRFHLTSNRNFPRNINHKSRVAKKKKMLSTSNDEMKKVRYRIGCIIVEWKLTLRDEKLSCIGFGVGRPASVVSGMDVLDVLQRQHRHSARRRQSQVRAYQSRAGGVTRFRIFAVFEKSSIVIPENHLRRIGCL